jgi:NAD(P)-dependent dehydrogenase (short-subunit alcohol dehydrogenase family)
MIVRQNGADIGLNKRIQFTEDSMDLQLAGKVAVITGASRGIGNAIAHELAAQGMRLVLAARSKDLLEQLANSLPTECLVQAMDLRDPQASASLITAAQQHFGGLDVLVNNAGITLRQAAFDVTPEEWDAVVHTNVTGTFFMSQQMGRHLVSGGRPGCIISIASTHGVVGMAQRSTYGISKAAIIHMTKMLAIEWAEHGIRVNAVAPGRVESGSPARAATVADSKYRESMLNRVPLHRFCTSDEVAGAVSYLASAQAEYVTGQTLLLDGGLTSY